MSTDRSGIMAQFTARTGTAPRARFYPTGELVWEFNVRVNDTWDPSGRTETVTVRAPDQHYGSLQNWVKPGALLLLRGWLTVVRWRTDDGRDKARLVVDCIDLTPLDVHIPGSAPAAMDYRGRVTAPAVPESPHVKQVDGTREERIKAARKMIEEVE